MTINGLDHVAMPIDHVEDMLSFYENLGFSVNRDAAPHFFSVHFGDNKINLHAPVMWKSEKFTLRGPTATPGCGDFCFVWSGTPANLQQLLRRHNVPIVEGPVNRVGGRNTTGNSTYIRDPDGNLLEFIIY